MFQHTTSSNISVNLDYLNNQIITNITEISCNVIDNKNIVSLIILFPRSDRVTVSYGTGLIQLPSSGWTIVR